MIEDHVIISISGNSASVANFFRGIGSFPIGVTATCACGLDGTETPPDYHATMEFERSRVLREGDPNAFERK